jgi:hypothetical protein
MKSKIAKGQQGVKLKNACGSNSIVALYIGLLWKVGDPRIPDDNSMQCHIPGTDFLIDARPYGKYEGPAHGKGHKINECWNPELANCRISAGTNFTLSLHYNYIIYTLYYY